MTRSFIPAITTGLRPTPLIIVYGAKPAARAFSSRRSKMYFFDFCCLFPGTFSQSASFSSTNIDAYYLILAGKDREHIDFNFTVDAKEHRTAHRGHRSAGRRVFRANAMACVPMPSRTTRCTVSLASWSRHYRAVQVDGSAKRPIHPEGRCSAKGRTACYNPDFENGRLLKLEKGSFATLGRFGDLEAPRLSLRHLAAAGDDERIHAQAIGQLGTGIEFHQSFETFRCNLFSSLVR